MQGSLFQLMQDPTGRSRGQVNWVAPPVGLPSVCSSLENWKKTQFYRVIEEDWTKDNAQKWFNVFANDIKQWMAQHIRKGRGAGYALVNDEILAGIQPDREEKEADREILRQTLRQALVYFVREVLDEDIILAVTYKMRAADPTMQDLDTINKWSKIQDYILEECTSVITKVMKDRDMISTQRKNGERLDLWVLRCVDCAS